MAVLLAAVMVFSLAACKTNDGDTTPSPTPATGEPGEVVADVPADRYDATATPRTGNNETNPLVVSTGTLDGKFSPFFATSAYDVDVDGMVQIGLLYYNKDGAPEAGINVPSLAYDYTQDISSDQSTSTYTFVLKNGITFSDGKPVTAKDVLFSMYVLSDPMYDGSSTFYTMDIQGLEGYRLQASSDLLEQLEGKTTAIIEAGISTSDDGSIIYNPTDGATAEEQEEFWDYLDDAGMMFAQDIIDYVYTSYPAYVGTDYFPGYELSDIAGNATLQTAFGMAMWGYGGIDGDTFTDNMGNTYDVTSDTLDAKIYWENIVDKLGYSLSEEDGINYEQAGSSSIEEYVKDLYVLAKGQEEGGVASISGITTGTVTDDDGVERETVQVVMDGVDPTAIFKLGVTVAPAHYYTDGYEGTLNDYGVEVGNRNFMSFLKTKNVKPVGAGPYVFQDYTDNVVTYTANDDFMLGSPKIKTFRYVEVALGAELDAAITDTVHYTDPSASMNIINDITEGSGDYSKLGYTLVDNDGYGYIGIQAQAIPEFEVRKALAHAMNVQLSVDDWYQELASVNYRTMTKILWAYPDNPENLFPFDETGETSKTLFEEAGYTYDEAENIMYYPEDHEKAGTQATFKFTIPGEAASDHPAGAIFINTQEVLSNIGVKVDMDLDENLLGKLPTAYESGVQVWAAAWGSGGVDPDMFQIWHSDPELNQGTSSTGLFWLFENGSDEEKAMLTELNELIMAGRSTLDTEERKGIYRRALELSTGIAAEIPTYQRKNMYVFNKGVVDESSLFSGEDVTPFQSPISFIWNVELN